ncbi:MAG TPA: membrane dipeptidase [Candidatus Rhabdochlamydia sp.]|jgi:microsomal dipeptidase-like Zn-dependent dipeptidase|nr:membrane dipeptidase [Candidatus Rhabdochlamydia sp.]
MLLPIFDLHNDLLSFLIEQENRSFLDPLSRCSYLQMKQGGVETQVLAIFTKRSSNSLDLAQKQIEKLQWLYKEHPSYFSPISKQAQPTAISTIAAFEGASGFADENEPLAMSLQRLAHYQSTIGPLFYIGITWNEENRFGGGSDTSIGLKPDGFHLLEWLDNRKIAIDLSHASDALAYDILTKIDQNNWRIPLIASHCNFRKVHFSIRNLPDELVLEVIHRRGLIGLNFFAPFVHKEDPHGLIQHVEYALTLNAKEALCFGADFFCDRDAFNLQAKYPGQSFYHAPYDTAACYPILLKKLALKLELPVLQSIACKNARTFLNTQILGMTTSGT